MSFDGDEEPRQQMSLSIYIAAFLLVASFAILRDDVTDSAAPNVTDWSV